MSRIERALEKALNIRRPMMDPGHSSIGPTTFSKCDPSVFEVGEGGVDPAVVNRHLVSITDPYSTAAEEYRRLRAKILRATKENYLNTIMVTSSQAGEGKSMTAINLAISIAKEIDHTVLLVDADLRKSSIHRYLGLNPKVGLSDYLQFKAELPDILIKTGIGKLVLLPAGNPPLSPSELISSERMRILIRELKFRYRDRYIIIDSSPLLMTAESLSLCNYTDGIIFVVQADRTSVRTATQAVSLLKGHNVLGTVFNDVPKHLAKNLYPYYSNSAYYGTITNTEDTENGVNVAENNAIGTNNGSGDAGSVNTANAVESGANVSESNSAGTDDGSGFPTTVNTLDAAESGVDAVENKSAASDDGNNGRISGNA